MLPDLSARSDAAGGPGGGFATTTYTYHGDQRETVVDPLGYSTTWTFDDYDRVESKIDPAGGITTTTYGDHGRPSEILNANGQLITRQYDTDGRLTTETWYEDGTTATVVDTLVWDYNELGELTSAYNSAGTYTYHYDSRGRLFQVDEQYDGMSGTLTLVFDYDQDDNRDLVVDSLGGEERSIYGGYGQLLERSLVRNTETARLVYTYQDSGLVEKVERHKQVAEEGDNLVGKTSYEYNALGQVTSIVSVDDADDPINSFTYSYNAEGLLIEQVDNNASTSGNFTFTYTYDPATGQLIGDGTDTFSWDKNGNDLLATITVGNQLDEDAGGWEYTYDNAGNVRQKEVPGDIWTYEYDNVNQLISVKHYIGSVTPGDIVKQVDYKYDVDGHRTQRTLDADGATPGGVTTEYYARDSWNEAMPTPIGTENGNVWADVADNGSLTTRYMYGDQFDEQLARVTPGAVTPTAWIYTDKLGSVRDIVTHAGDIVDSLSYGAFGNILAGETDDTSRGRYAWTGRELDVETELQYNRARYYDAVTRRWISMDPLGFDAGDSNLYRYVNNAPAIYTDASGLELVGARSDDLNDFKDPVDTALYNFKQWLEGDAKAGGLTDQFGMGPGIKGLRIIQAPIVLDEKEEMIVRGQKVFSNKQEVRRILTYTSKENLLAGIAKIKQPKLKEWAEAMLVGPHATEIFWQKNFDGAIRLKQNGAAWSIHEAKTSLQDTERFKISLEWGFQWYKLDSILEKKLADLKSFPSDRDYVLREFKRLDILVAFQPNLKDRFLHIKTLRLIALKTEANIQAALATWARPNFENQKTDNMFFSTAHQDAAILSHAVDALKK